MSKLVLVDTGPLVALRNERDSRHAVCVEALKELPKPLLTCWPVLTEAAYLLRHYPRRVRELLASTDGEFLRVLALGHADTLAINSILEKYEDQSFQLADAALMHLAEREDVDAIFTLDRKDFQLYRVQGSVSLRLFPE